MVKEVIPLVSEDALDPTFADYIAKKKQTRKWVANNAYALANAPELGMAARHIFDAAIAVGSIPRELRFLIRYVVSNANQCRYCMTHQVNFLRHDFGVSLERMRAAMSAEDSPLFSDREKAALAYAKALTLGAGSVPEHVYDELIKHFTPKERVEITVIAAAMNMINIVNDGLRVPLEEQSLEAFARATAEA